VSALPRSALPRTLVAADRSGRAAHTDKCVNVNGGSPADTAAIIRWTCVGGPGGNDAFHVRLQP
jgi:hypothetical protein